MTRYVCIHGHFYQPPRENPWLESIELQDSAYPFHDWNERITEECYAQNAASRVLDEFGRIVHIVNNYASMSFNVGPTLLAWMEEVEPELHAAIIEADQLSAERFDGHGSAMAQAYNHLIMPLANARDRRTQVAWGIADFEHRFGRRPEGMWLPETAVDIDSLEALAEHDIRFTILEPHQAARVRELDGGTWTDVSDGSIDTGRAYRVDLPSGRTIAVFFYDGPTSRAVAFEGLLADGAALAARLLSRFPDHDDGPRLVNIATDGESYGHHHRHGDMALAFAIHELDKEPDVELTNYAAYLDRFPPQHEVEIAEDTSWSCAHGVERWRSDCGCADGGHPDWNQAWRTPLRDALDHLRDELAPRYEEVAGRYLADPWGARDAYIEVLLDRSRFEDFLAAHARRQLDDDERIAVRRLLELQRHAMLMFTSCGWFFDDLCRIEAIQVLRYAGRALQLAGEALGDELESGFVRRLAEARSNDPDCGDGEEVYRELVDDALVEPSDVAAHYAASSLFERYGSRTRIHCYDVESLARRDLVAGEARLALGRIRITDAVTGASHVVEYGVLHLGDHNLDGGVRGLTTDADLEEAMGAIEAPFVVADIPETIRLLDRHFPHHFTLGRLFRDEQRRILQVILDSSVAEARSAYRAIYRNREPLMRYLQQLDVGLPRTFHRAAEVVVNDDLRQLFADPDLDPVRVRTLLDDARTYGLELDTAGLAHVLNTTVARVTHAVHRDLAEPALFDHFGEVQERFFERALRLVDLARSLPFEVDLWSTQNVLFDTVQEAYPGLRERAAAGDEDAARWVEGFKQLGDALSVAVD